MKKLILILAILLVSCSTRKVNKSQVDIKQSVIETVKDTISNISVINEIKVDTSLSVVTQFEPIDSSKTFIVNGKTYQNVRFKTSFTKNGINTTKKENRSIQSLKISQKKINTDIKQDEKQTYREPAFNWFWIWLIIIVAAILLWYEFKR
jgi:PBP1b-binding outer membrane lipoprotein LpoB